MRNITTQKHTIKYILILVMIAITVHVEAADNSVELPDGVEARLGKGRIFSMQYSDDGTRLALATSMGVWIYDTVTYKEVYLLKGHDRRPAQILAFSTDGKMLATAAMFGTVNFWDTDTGEHQHQIIIEEGIVKVVFGIDGSTFCILGGSGSVMLFDILNWEEKHNYENILDFRKEGIFSMAISPDSFNIVTGHQNGRVAIYDAFFNAKQHEFEELTDLITSLALSSSEKFLAGANFRSLCWWDMAEKAVLHKIDGNLNVSTITFSPDDSLIASGSHRGDISLWDVSTGELQQTLKGHTAKVIDVAFSSDLRSLASVGLDGSVRIWDVFSAKEIHVFEGHFGNFTFFDVSSDGTKVVAPTKDLTVCLWDIASEKVETTFDKEGYFSVADAAFSPTEKIIATASYGKFISLWDSDTYKLLSMLKGHEGSVFSTEFSPDGKTIVSGSEDGSVRLWDVDTFSVKHVLKGHALEVMTVAFSPDGTTIASGGVDSLVIVWDAETGAQKRVLDSHALGVTGIAYSPDGTMIASVDETRKIILWNVATGEEERTISSRVAGISCVVFHPNGKVLATGRESGVVEFFDVSSGESVLKFSGHLDKVTDLGFALDGTRLVSRSDDGVMYVWDISSLL